MEVNCLTLKDLISPRQTRLDFAVEDAETAQKENIFVDRSRMTPKTPMKNEPIDLSKQRIFTPERSPITPVKLVDRQPQVEPWTPTANLKMLISAASPDIRDREKKKELFRPIENKGDAFVNSLQLDVVGDSAVDDYEKRRPSRKQKSLGLLCQKFLARYPSYPLSTEKTTISLDEVAVSLGVERRRIYDIVNVLESLHLVSRVAKNQYGWHGRHSLPKTLRTLQRLGEEQKYEEQMACLQQKELDLMEYRFGERRKDGSPDPRDQHLLDFSESDYPSSSANSRKDKSLRIMSQKFVMLFLVSKTKIVTLDVAAKILIEESQDTPDHSKFKTKVRRLYDIANVLTSLALIKKVHVTEERGRKPAFKWIGPVDFSSIDEELLDVSASVLPELKKETYGQIRVCAKERLARYGSFNTVQTSEKIQRKVNSEPSSPQGGKQGPAYSLEIGSLAAIYRQKVEDSSQGEAFVNKRAAPPASVLDPTLPVDSEYCVKPLAQPVFSVAQTDLQAFSAQNGLNGQVGVPVPSAASDAETLKSALLASQPLVYVPSTSLFMLYGSVQEALSPESRSEEDGSGSDVPADLSLAPTAQKRLCEERNPLEDDEPAVKRQSREFEDSPLSLVMPKKPSNSTDLAFPVTTGNGRATPLEDACVKGQLPAAEDASGRAVPNGFIASECGNPSRNPDTEKSSNDNEITKDPSLLQYLYVQSPAGLNGFNMLLPGGQTPHAVAPSSAAMPSFGVPCMFLPSPGLGPFPVLYSPAIPGPISSAPGTLPNTGPMNFGLSTLASASHLLISPAAMVNPKSSTLPSADPQLRCQPPLNPNPVMPGSHGVIHPESPGYMRHPVSMVKAEQSPAPATPKSIQRRHRETFFKTPGSLGDPAFRRERNQSRNTSSAQRRLEISSSGPD
ncbi:transcription factor E2F7 isoform X1 [Rattus norvegicus]|uniref:Transcription factor E2F7 n=1 Tax=Rattus norvegicus TaxID=10116 RepID=E2F7_RAT|nr:transcription factor E2F7 [Rattus norvegicus]XP_006241383.1 transcription factor E2F7 isoform X1 [Rattus norvegicus]D4A4D7.1 RecName: Full=Transcription factor E2F7; Short=E2F-7 [Rattus norvegicus]|eukprot:XP_006241382.1 PREDICTED: transcription factor E2F7 isoform X1 [Rattus norvegicus]